MDSENFQSLSVNSIPLFNNNILGGSCSKVLTTLASIPFDRSIQTLSCLSLSTITSPWPLQAGCTPIDGAMQGIIVKSSLMPRTEVPLDLLGVARLEKMTTFHKSNELHLPKSRQLSPLEEAGFEPPTPQ